MTPTMEAPVDTGASAPTTDSVLDDIGNILGGSESAEAPAEEQPAEVEQPAEETAQATEEAQPAEETTTEPKPAEEGEYPLSEDGQSYMVPKAELADIKAMREYHTAVQEMFPTVQDAQAARGDAIGSRKMWNDIVAGTPQAHDALLKFLAGNDVDPRYPDLKAQVQRNFFKMAERIPETLRSMNAEVANNFTNSIIQNEINAAYLAAAQSGNPADLKSAQWLDYGWTGQYKTELPKITPAQPDAVDARMQELEKRENSMMDRDWKEFDKTNLEPKKWGDFYTEVDRTLAPFKDKYSPITFNYIRQGIVNDVRAKLLEDKIWAEDHGNTLVGLKQAFEQRWRAGQRTDDLMPSINAFRNDFMVRARRHLPSIAKQALESTPPNKTGAAVQKKVQQAPPGGQTVRAANGQFQKTAPSKGGLNKEQQEAKILNELESLL